METLPLIRFIMTSEFAAKSSGNSNIYMETLPWINFIMTSEFAARRIKIALKLGKKARQFWHLSRDGHRCHSDYFEGTKPALSVWFLEQEKANPMDCDSDDWVHLYEVFEDRKQEAQGDQPVSRFSF